MNRKEFFAATAKAGAGCCALAVIGGTRAAAAADDGERQFVKNWVTDLFEAIDEELDDDMKLKLMAGCGKGCFRRHSFKTDIAKAGKGNVDNLVQAYTKVFEAWREGDAVHIRFGAEVKQCFCPAARYHPAKMMNDLHCECTRACHQAIFETALQRPIKVEVVESVRRGGRTCHFIARVG